ncbi:Odorant receptor 395 [Nylanderia fulva]|uniref:Odorant receptor 395 n=1 Tax=Nylanderia fulva TaxID=613905 RepID=A0A6G1LR28_9HYME|nr:Odorant receptor 395 [Nylanderia fulva]
MIVTDWTRKKTEKERVTMMRNVKIAKILITLGYIMMVIAIFTLIVPPCFEYSIRYVTNITNPGKPFPNLKIMFFAQAMAIILSAFTYTGIDNFLGLLVFHICGQMEILKKRLLNFDEFKDFNVGLSMNVRNHVRLIRFVFCIVHMCVYCVVGDMLIKKCDDIFYAVYDFAWYTLKPNEARSLMLIMIRAEKPLYITAGKIFPMTLSMFCSLLKTSAGYISVLHANH